MISIVTATYNSAHTIVKSIKSVKNQIDDNWELIIIDDGSSDNTKEVVDFLQNSKIKFYSQKNKGVSAARNFGVKKASGKYILFLDADDELFENAINDFNNMLKSTINIGIASADYIHSPHTRVKPRKKGILFHNYKINNLVGSYIVLKTVFDAVGGFDENLKYSENWELFIRLTDFCNKNGLKVVNGDFLTFMYNYCNSEEKNVVRKNKIIETYKYLYSKYKNFSVSNFNYAFSFAETIAYNAFLLGRKKQALHWQKSAIKNNLFNLKSYLKFLRYQFLK